MVLYTSDYTSKLTPHWLHLNADNYHQKELPVIYGSSIQDSHVSNSLFTKICYKCLFWTKYKNEEENMVYI